MPSGRLRGGRAGLPGGELSLRLQQGAGGQQERRMSEHGAVALTRPTLRPIEEAFRGLRPLCSFNSEDRFLFRIGSFTDAYAPRAFGFGDDA